ncbi:MAG: hypothetical protein MI745_14050 [Pseudomonadales bacterium]|nr:hypothetical protein [Pseudomonadales bacterium]
MCLGPEAFFIAQVAGTALQGIGAARAGEAEAEARGRNAGRILAESKIKQEQTKQAQERRRGATRAAFAKAGVRITGSAKRLIEEQIEQDELQLFSIQQQGNIEAEGEIQRGAEAVRRGQSGLLRSGLQVGGLFEQSRQRQEALERISRTTGGSLAD